MIVCCGTYTTTMRLLMCLPCRPHREYALQLSGVAEQPEIFLCLL